MLTYQQFQIGASIITVAKMLRSKDYVVKLT